MKGDDFYNQTKKIIFSYQMSTLQLIMHVIVRFSIMNYVK